MVEANIDKEDTVSVSSSQSDLKIELERQIKFLMTKQEMLQKTIASVKIEMEENRPSSGRTSS